MAVNDIYKSAEITQTTILHNIRLKFTQKIFNNRKCGTITVTHNLSW